MRRIGTLNHKPIVEGDSNIVDKILYYIKLVLGISIREIARGN